MVNGFDMINLSFNRFEQQGSQATILSNKDLRQQSYAACLETLEK